MSKTIHLVDMVLARFWQILSVAWLLIIATGCAKPAPAALDLTTIFPDATVPPGWTISQKAATYHHDTLYNLVDGQADSFFAYGFEQAAVQRYQNGEGTQLNVEIWQLANPADAYGLFSAGRRGATATIGNAGDSDPGRRLAFWQNRYFVSLSASCPVPDADLQAFGQSIAKKLPSGGAAPAVVNRLPKSGLSTSGPIFFHEEMSVQMEIWLGGENLLGLSHETNGIIGRYVLGNIPARLMLIEYPTSGQAASALTALQKSPPNGLVASDVKSNLLGAVFGKLDTPQASALLQEALK